MRYVKIRSEWLGHSDCDTCEVRASALFAWLDAETLAGWRTQLDDLAFPRNSVVFHQGALADATFTIRSGAIKMVRYQPDGSQRIVRVLRPGDIAGLEAVVGGNYESTAITLGEVRACRIPASLIELAMQGNPPLVHRVLEKYQGALRETEAWLAELSAGSAPARVRVARLFTRLHVADSKPCAVIKVGAADIGDILGITVETASRVVAAFKREGLLQDPGRLAPYYVADLEGLSQASQGGDGRRCV